jgi:hypothetical protein
MVRKAGTSTLQFDRCQDRTTNPSTQRRWGNIDVTEFRTVFVLKAAHAKKVTETWKEA